MINLLSVSINPLCVFVKAPHKTRIHYVCDSTPPFALFSFSYIVLRKTEIAKSSFASNFQSPRSNGVRKNDSIRKKLIRYIGQRIVKFAKTFIGNIKLTVGREFFTSRNLLTSAAYTSIDQTSSFAPQ